MQMPTSLTQNTLVFVLAGGRGERLFPLTRDRAKGAVPFAGQYRLIDFTLANCSRARLQRIFVLTQYKSASLEQHLRQRWNFSARKTGEFLHVIPPRYSTNSGKYLGTADAVRHNLNILLREKPSHVLVLSSDHLYDMDYTRFLDYHIDSGAQMTIASMRVSPIEAQRFGIMQVDSKDQVLNFEEKPTYHTLPHCNSPLASMGIYIFETNALVEVLQDRQGHSQSRHDFGRDIIPHMLANGYPISAYDVCAGEQMRSFYWKDIGTLDSYWDASMELLSHATPFDLFNSHNVHPWPFSQMTQIRGRDAHTWICAGTTIDSARVQRSIISSKVRVGRGAEITDSILMDGVQVGAGARIHKAIIDKNVHIPAHYSLDSGSQRSDFHCTPSGVVVLPKNIDLVRWQHDVQYARDYFGHGASVRPFAPPDSQTVRALARFQVLPPPPEIEQAAYRLVHSIARREKMANSTPEIPA